MSVAAALTAAAVAALSVPVFEVIRAARDATVASATAPSETIVYVSPLTPARSMQTSPTRAQARHAAPPFLASPALPAATLAPVAPIDTAPTPTLMPDSVKPVPTTFPTVARPRVLLGPVRAPSAFTRPSEFGTPGYETVMSALARGRSFRAEALALPPTAAQRDSFYREQSERNAGGREEHSPAPVVSGAGFSLPLPLFSTGPSRKQRMRDSIIHQDNLRTLARLAERAQAKRDSMRVADSTRRARPLPN